MTQITQVITQYCAQYVDDIRMSRKNDPNSPFYDQPLYAREMWGYLLPAISMFTLPSEMGEYLVGSPADPKLVSPNYTSAIYTVNTDETADFVISLGAEYKNFEIYSVRLKETDAAGYPYYVPLNANYDPLTGDVTVIVPAGDTIAEGSVIDMDFYTDGYFVNTLSPRMMNILGKAFNVVWQSRFNTDWLSIVAKIDDKSFTEQNRGTKMNADTARLDQLYRIFAGDLRKYEQDVYKANHTYDKLKLI